ncbi:D-2-hydroxyacid dehydrogenase family protein [Roseinatronobacter sp.]|uniref:D-2-hydroxyacid dehydrogenase family protein n=1 Tax=Roseinatronobacter sp. TaxID=1945755 RepID=UPI003F6F4E32
MKIAILDDYAGVALAYGNWGGLGDITVFRDTLPMGASLVARLKPFDVVCVMRERTPLPAALIEALPKLRLVVTSGPRNGSIDLAAARAAGVTVCATQSRKTTTAELTLLLMLALNRQFLPNVQSLRSGGWQGALGRDLAGLRLGLVGLGTIGAQVATLAQALGMTVCAWSQNLSAERAAECGAEQMPSLPALMAASDVVSVHLVLADRTRGLIGPAAFSAMRDGAVFINTSRAGLVDNTALLAGLRQGRPAAAGLDVFDTEPLPASHPMMDADLIAEGKLLLTPHLGYTTEATLRLFYSQMADAVRAWTEGAPIRQL